MNDMNRFENEEFGMHLMDAKDVDPIEMLIEDHNHVKQNFKDFENADSDEAKLTLFIDTVLSLVVHSKIEEELIYPLLKKADEELIAEAFEEHHVVDLVISEMKALAPGDKKFAAKFKVLSDLVKHHIEEEEIQALPELEVQTLDKAELAKKMVERRQQLKDQYNDISKVETVQTEGASAHRKTAVKRKAARKPVPRRKRSSSAAKTSSSSRATARSSKGGAKGSKAAKETSTAKSTAGKKRGSVSSTRGGSKSATASNGASGGGQSRRNSTSKKAGSTGDTGRKKSTTGRTKSGSKAGAERRTRSAGNLKTGDNSRNTRNVERETDVVRLTGKTRSSNVYSLGEAGGEVAQSANPQS